MSVYYNELDPFAAAWLRELMKAGQIQDGEVDERSIELVQPDDVRGFTQCHFFAGIGGWAYALRLAGWGDRAVWTGSCPCQPFSSAGAQAGGHDPRDLWPVWFQLIAECRPVVVFGEQVEAAIGHGWLDRLCDDLEAEDYAVGACGLPGPCVGAYDPRHRVWFVADTDRCRSSRTCSDRDKSNSWADRWNDVAGRCATSRLGNSEADGSGWGAAMGRETWRRPEYASGMEHAISARLEGHGGDDDDGDESGWDAANTLGSARAAGATGDMGISDDRREATIGSISGRSSVECVGGFWAEAEWLMCRDGKARPVESGTFPLAHGVPARVGRLRGYGNAIKPQVAQAFIEAYLSIDG